jgi:5-methylcytosine-specific restriction endonuclease McrA
MNKFFLFGLLISQVVLAQPIQPTQELRYCGPAPRDKSGNIIRRTDVQTAFKKIHPCPATGLSTGSCPNWQMDHIIPLACGGCDAVINLQWLPNNIKTAPVIGKDRFERKIYCSPMTIVK